MVEKETGMQMTTGMVRWSRGIGCSLPVGSRRARGSRCAVVSVVAVSAVVLLLAMGSMRVSESAEVQSRLAATPAGAKAALAGDESSKPSDGAPSSCGRAINNHGVVVGDNETPDGVQRAFLWSPGDPNSGVGAHMEDLGKADGSHLGASVASGINDSGLVVGWVDTPGQRSAFVWDPARRDIRLLPPLSHDDLVFEAYAVNEQGLAIGDSDMVPVIWDLGREPIVCEPLFAGEEIAAHGSHAYAINRRGEIVGWGYRLNLDPLGFLCAWNREEGKAENLSFDVANWEPWAVNDELDIAGHFYPYPVLWQVRKRELHLLPLLDATSWGVAKGVNAQPMAVGYCGSEGPRRACAWYFDPDMNHYLSHWAVQALAALGGPECGSEALAVNDKGQVVGRSETAPGSGVWHACLWERDQEGKWSIRDLGTLP